jgi:hypothetical protein
VADRQERVSSGDRFRVISDMETVVLVCSKAPFTSGEPCVIPSGTIVVAEHDQLEGRPGFGCVPEDYEGLLPLVVPERDRINEKFDGYYFVFRSEDIGDRLEGLYGTTR